MSIAKRLDEKYDLARAVRMVRCQCVTASPLTVTLSGGSDAIPASGLAGQTWSTGDAGYALRVDGLPPICIKIA